MCYFIIDMVQKYYAYSPYNWQTRVLLVNRFVQNLFRLQRPNKIQQPLTYENLEKLFNRCSYPVLANFSRRIVICDGYINTRWVRTREYGRGGDESENSFFGYFGVTRFVRYHNVNNLKCIPSYKIYNLIKCVVSL